MGHSSQRQQAVRKTIETARKTVVEYCQSNGASAEETMRSLRELNRKRNVLDELADRSHGHGGEPANCRDCVEAVVIQLPRR
jgi:hypothetical protein